MKREWLKCRLQFLRHVKTDCLWWPWLSELVTLQVYADIEALHGAGDGAW